MTLFDLVEEVQEKTHLGELEILDRVQRAWPSHQQFTPTQVALMGEAEADALAVAILQQTNRYRREAAERAAKK